MRHFVKKHLPEKIFFYHDTLWRSGTVCLHSNLHIMPRGVPYNISEENVRFYYDLAIVKKDLPSFLLAQSLWNDILPTEDFLSKHGHNSLIATFRSSYQEIARLKHQTEKSLSEKEELLKDEAKLRLKLKSEHVKAYRTYDDWQEMVYCREVEAIERNKQEAYEAIPEGKKHPALLDALERYFENQKEIVKRFYADFPLEETIEELRVKIQIEIKEIRQELAEIERLFSFNETLFREIESLWTIRPTNSFLHDNVD